MMQGELQDTSAGRFRIVSVGILVVVFLCILVGFLLGQRAGKAVDGSTWIWQLFGIQNKVPEETYPIPSWVTALSATSLTPTLEVIQVNTPTPPVQASTPSYVAPAPAEANPGCGEIERVLIITVDGLRPDVVVNDKGAQYLLNLAHQGAYTWRAETVHPALTLPGITSLLTGYDVPYTGVDSNEYYKTPGARVLVETIFQRAKEAGKITAMISGKKHLTYFEQDEHLDYHLVKHGVSDDEIANIAIQYFQGNDFDLMLVHLADVDKVGHKVEWMTPGYLAAVSRANTAVRKIMTALEAAGLADSTMVILTADHGGVGTSHSDATNPDNRYIPWIVVGPCVKFGHEIQQNVHIYDTAAVALWGLGSEIPVDFDGVLIEEAFSVPAGEPDHVTLP